MQNRLDDVTPSVMPKGVEHFAFAAAHGLEKPVTPSVMPKGVEHTARNDSIIGPTR